MRVWLFLAGIILCSCSNLLNGFAQSVGFCLPGARWLYYLQGEGIIPPFQKHVYYAGDTTVNQFSNVKILKNEFRQLGFIGEVYYSESSKYLRTSGDSLFIWIDGNFEFVFDQSAQVGDSMVVYIGGGEACTSYDTLVVESITTMDYQGLAIPVLNFHILIEDQIQNAPFWVYVLGDGYGQFAQRIGFLDFHPAFHFLNCTGATDYAIAEFECYTDNELSVQFPDMCNEFLNTQELYLADPPEILFQQGQIEIFATHNCSARVFDMFGRPLTQVLTGLGSMALNLHGIRAGLYVVNGNHGGRGFSYRFAVVY